MSSCNPYTEYVNNKSLEILLFNSFLKKSQKLEEALIQLGFWTKKTRVLLGWERFLKAEKWIMFYLDRMNVLSIRRYLISW